MFRTHLSVSLPEDSANSKSSEKVVKLKSHPEVSIFIIHNNMPRNRKSKNRREFVRYSSILCVAFYFKFMEKIGLKVP